MADAPAVLEGEALAAELAKLPDWEIRDGWLRRTFHTPGWPHTMMLVQAVGLLAEAAWHHPDIRIGYAIVTVMLQTHSARGITLLDFELATKIDSLALWKPAPTSSLTGFPKKWIH